MDCLQIMQEGTELVKLRTNVRQFRRIFTLDADLSHIRWTPTNKKPHKARSKVVSGRSVEAENLVAVDSIREVRVGRNTETLRATENNSADMQVRRGAVREGTIEPQPSHLERLGRMRILRYLRRRVRMSGSHRLVT